MVARSRPDPAEDAPHGGHGWESQVHVLGEYIRSQRQLANLSLRRLAELAEVSNPYLSQLERGLHEPSVRVLNQVARALRMPVEDFFDRLGHGDPGADAAEGALDPSADGEMSTVASIQRDRDLSDEQKMALLGVYRSYVDANGRAASQPAPGRRRPPTSGSAASAPIPAGEKAPPRNTKRVPRQK